jgi:hypothetical protein
MMSSDSSEEEILDIDVEQTKNTFININIPN